MPVLYVRLTIILGLSLGVIGLAAGSEWTTGAQVNAASPIQWHCPPCGKQLSTSTELVWLHGKRWAVCSSRCEASVAADAMRFAGLSID